MRRLVFVLLLFFIQFTVAQQGDYVDFKTANVQVSFSTDSSKVVGHVTYKFDILKPVDSIFIDAVNMVFSNVKLNTKTATYSNNGKRLWLKHNFTPNRYSVSFNYVATPQKALYFIDWNIENGNEQIWTQGQGKYTSNWLPSFDDMTEKVEFDISVVFQEGFQVIANGKNEGLERLGHSKYYKWQYNMEAPMSSYLVALAIGKYNSLTEYSKSGVPLVLYYYPKDSLKVEPTYRYTKAIFNFLEDEIGVSYPWQNYKQVPVKDFLYAGMENTSTTIFADSFVTDSIAFIDKNYVNVNAHELAHQWFGNLVTETSSKHHWLQEGFATYYALLAERHIFGDNYYYWRLYEYAQELLNQDRAEVGTSLLNPESSSTTFYKRGAWVLHMLREQIGNTAFKKAVKQYLEIHKFKNVETKDFMVEAEKVSGQELDYFMKIWLEDQVFNYNLALESLKKSAFIQEYLMADCEVYTSKCKDYLASGISSYAKAKIIAQIPQHITKVDFKNNLKIRQAIAEQVREIPVQLKPQYESLLNDNSYLTKQIALHNLWLNFPENRALYLNKTKGIDGFSDKNIKLLWLTLALITDNFEPENKPKYYNELINYTSPNYGFEIRQNAFSYLQAIQACNVSCVAHLKAATNHHNWRFSKFAKQVLEQLNNN